VGDREGCDGSTWEQPVLVRRRGSVEPILKIQQALEAAGVEFIPADDEKGPGLRLKHKMRGKRGGQAGMRGKSA
jgi:hypothetical protein